jgi:hypothetical protein
MPIFHRRPDPPAESNYKRYKQALREDFQYRCAYCILHEGDPYGAGFHNFQIDHFRPRNKIPELINTYSNLYYACRWCNGAKADKWPLDDEQTLGFVFVDPCVEDLFTTHADLNSSTGKLEPRTNAGDFTITEIRLNRRMFNDLRKKRVKAQDDIDSTTAQILRLESEQDPPADLIAFLKEKIALLDEKYINPKVPYEPSDLQVDS